MRGRRTNNRLAQVVLRHGRHDDAPPAPPMFSQRAIGEWHLKVSTNGQQDTQTLSVRRRSVSQLLQHQRALLWRAQANQLVGLIDQHEQLGVWVVRKFHADTLCQRWWVG